MIKKSKDKKTPKEGIPIPAGTEQETGFTRAETEKETGPVKLSRIKKRVKNQRAT